ncbi:MULTISPECIES: TIGR04141 family sporadically distributed protein [unclassified Gilliamella]|uniref:TIGR04141 family sporadically distributed protein n=1 Tax=unclassified Gilliamella TaxID=2685620 RepID=UPI0022698A98|nr:MULTISPECIES: TIGR04141 family sporadically distributed protein [unclassified Gilliamella]MCX8665227.1 TIGR04141 family sporadically distributed protein [Gilliamella sp. B2887]MCX8697701.1 TIGR04141 family sporadically distributed protein [Gilliamella sp. B3000]
MNNASKINKPYLCLNAMLVEKKYNTLDFSNFLKTEIKINSYDLDDKYKLDGKFYVKISTDKKPEWHKFTENITGKSLDELMNRSSSAVLFIKNQDVIIAFTFGYGLFLIDTKYFVQDFGIKTALNTLKHDSLRSIDLHTLDDQSIQKRSQASRNSGVTAFGIDISKDVLRAVTGTAKKGINFKNISGGDAVYSFSVEINIEEIPNLVTKLFTHYNNDSYKVEFSWVDNIRKIKEKTRVDALDNKLLENIQQKSTEIMITIPEIIQWDSVYGFSFTRSKHIIKPTIETKEYLDNIDPSAVNIKSIKRDRLHVFDINENETEYPIYNCIYFEHKKGSKTFVLFSGQWYEIDNNFIKRINSVLNQIDISELQFPTVYDWSNGNKPKLEAEQEYNKRTAKELDCYLLDKRLIKSNRTTTPIEVCDLLTKDKKFIHVKHRKGGSAGLSHLFSQAKVSSEVLLGDKEFRKAVSKELKISFPKLKEIIPINQFKSDGVEVILLILGENSSTLKNNLPFFSKVNLADTYQNLTQKGFKVTIAGAEKEQKI